MVIPAGGGAMGPPSQYTLNVMPRIKLLLVAIFICGILRACATTLKNQSVFEGLMDLTSCLFGFVLFRNVATLGQCSCGFMTMCFLNCIYDCIFAIMWFTSVGRYAFSTSGNIEIRQYNEDITWKFPMTSVLFMIVPPLQFYTGYIGYKMFKSMQLNEGISDGWDNGMGMAQVGMLQHHSITPREEGSNQVPPSRASVPSAGFVPFAGQGQRL